MINTVIKSSHPDIHSRNLLTINKLRLCRYFVPGEIRERVVKHLVDFLSRSKKKCLYERKTNN